MPNPDAQQPAPPAHNAPAPLGIALIGVGTVGAAVYQLLTDNAAAITAKCGRPLRVTSAVKRDRANTRHLPANLVAVLRDNWQAAVAHPQTDIVVELIGGDTDAKNCITAAFAANKPVVTANKALLAALSATDQDLLAAADSRPPIALEASIAGCIPIVKVLQQSLASDSISEIYGIINGTCNYILSAMDADGVSFADALANAQRLGFAEAAPDLDIDAADAAHKLLLLTRFAFGMRAALSDIPTTGIRDFDRADIAYARQFGFCVKLLAVASAINDDENAASANAVQCRVCPTLVPLSHPLAAINGSVNAVMTRSAYAGDMAYIGAGAGGKPTAVAVVADIMDIARAYNNPPAAALPSHPATPPAPSRRFQSRRYMRLRVTDRPGILATVAADLAQEDISIESIQQRPSESGAAVDVIFILHRCDDARAAAAIAQINGREFMAQPAVSFPILSAAQQ